MCRKGPAVAIAVTFFCLLLSAQQPPPQPEANPITADDVIKYLSQVVTWYEHVVAIDERSSLTENILMRNTVRALANRALQSSFVFARAQAAALSMVPASGNATAATPSMQQSLTKASDRVTHLQQRLQSLDARIEHASGSQRDALTDERVAIAADLALAKQMEAAVKTMASFSAPAKGKGHGALLDEINNLAALHPISNAPVDDKDKPPATAPAAPVNDFSAFHPEGAGILVLASKTVGFYNTNHRIDLVRAETTKLGEDIDALRAPLRKSVRAIIAESDNISNSEDSAIKPEQWLNTGKQISELGSRFKQLATVVIPLGETAMSLQSARASLDEWHRQVESDYSSTLRYLIVRLSVLLGGVLLILFGSAIWQRAIDHYVAEPRRRRQLLLVKRVFVGLALALLLTFGFFSSLGSIATLLGFITAGLALALQNVILSAVAYFFLIGKYGLRVGDRVSVQGVTGEVIEVGLIRLFLMELTGSGTDLHPTGRLAVFANSVIFQPSALMKQAPGLAYTWHAVSVTVENPADYQQTRARLTDAITAVYADYRLAIEQQHKAFEQTTHVAAPAPAPISRAQFAENGLEITIRYPVSLTEQPGHIDERMVDCLVAEAEKEPKLKFATGGSPKTSQVV